MTTGTSSIVQVRPGELADVLTADFQRRAEPQFAWKSCISQFLALPGLRGFWPMSSIYYSASPRVADLSGQGNDLDDNNTVTFGRENLAPYAGFASASSQYLNRADGGASNWADILGTESYMTSALRGLTLGGWFRANTLTGNMVVMGKGISSIAAQLSYLFFWRGDLATDPFLFRVSTGAAVPGVTSSVTTSTGQWHFAVARFTPSTSLGIYVNGTWTSSGSAPAAIADTSYDFTIGATALPSAYFNGRASMCFLCAAALPDAIVGQLYEQSRVMFGVL